MLQTVNNNVLPFEPRGTMPVMLPIGWPEDVGTITMRGDSLLHSDNIHDGDPLIMRTDLTESDLTPGSLCVYGVTSSGEKCVKRIVETSADKIAFRSNFLDSPEVFDRDEIVILGIVFSFQRML